MYRERPPSVLATGAWFRSAREAFSPAVDRTRVRNDARVRRRQKWRRYICRAGGEGGNAGDEPLVLEPRYPVEGGVRSNGRNSQRGERMRGSGYV